MSTAEHPARAEIRAIMDSRDLVSTDKVIRLVKQSGFRINNLFETSSGLWQANLRRHSPDAFFQFAWGPTPAHALAKALETALNGPPVPPVRANDGPAALTNVIGSTKAAEMATPPAVEAAERLGLPEPKTQVAAFISTASDDLDDLLG